MSGPSTYEPKSAFTRWLDRRLPILRLTHDSFVAYPTPRNLNYWWTFGAMLSLCLIVQIVTGVVLAMHYTPHIQHAFASVQRLDRDVPFGWLIQNIHSVGASMFFLAVYIHMFRGLYYGSYKAPRELLWILGCVIYLLMVATGFLGYTLPWGQMSFWGAQVIISLFGAIPVIGGTLTEWIRGDYVVSDITLNRFFSLHVIALPFAIAGLVFLHIIALHEVGSNNPDGVEIKKKKDSEGRPLDGIPFHPYYSVKDFAGILVFLMLFSAVVFFAPEMGGYFLEANNFIPANPMQTPLHIAPVWYFTPYYSILRANTVNFFWIDAKLWGVIFMGLGVMAFFFLPWLDRSPVKSIRYRGGLYKTILGLFVVVFLILGYLGLLPPTEGRTLVAQICTVLYFLFFLLMPIYTKLDKTKPVPDRVTH